MLGLGSVRVGIDPGTANTLLYVRGRGIALNEPSVLTIRAESGRIEFVGEEAELGRGRIPRKFDLRRPIHRGVITDSGLFEAMLSVFLRRAKLNQRLRRLRIAIAVPGGLNQHERLDMAQLIRRTVDADVFPVDQALAAATGAGAPLEEGRACAIVDIGAGATQIAVLSGGRVVCARSLPIAGQDLDAAIAVRTEAAHGLLIGEPTAERLKIRIGSAVGAVSRESLPVMGRSVAKGVPQGAIVPAAQVHDAILPVLDRIGDAVQGTLDAAPLEVLRRMADAGIVLTGGSALLRDIDQYFARRSGLPVRVAEAPASCVARGLGHCLQQHRAYGWEPAPEDPIR
jgi:rod shape-determining protein MreB